MTFSYGRPLKGGVDACSVYCQLTQKEREVLDHILLHKSLKVIACDLGVTIGAVDQRLKSARNKLDAADRNDAARLYRDLRIIYNEAKCGFSEIDEKLDPPAGLTPAAPTEAKIVFQDSAAIEVIPAWPGPSHPAIDLRLVDTKSKNLLCRIAIIVFVIATVILSLAVIAVANSLSTLL